LTIWANDVHILRVQTQYELDGETWAAPQRGGGLSVYYLLAGGGSEKQFFVPFVDEDLRSFELVVRRHGGYQSHSSSLIIGAIRISTTKRQFPWFKKAPKSDEVVSTLTIPPGTRFAGFYGYAGNMVDALGILLASEKNSGLSV